MYNNNEGYAPGLSSLEKSMTEIKPFSAGSDVTIFEFLDKFNTYCTGAKKAKAYKLYNNYLSPFIQVQTASFQQDFDALLTYLKVNSPHNVLFCVSMHKDHVVRPPKSEFLEVLQKYFGV